MEAKEKKPGWIGWLTQRFHLRPIKKHIIYHRIEKEPWYYGDGATLLMLLAVLYFTGGVMGLTYSASPASAYGSVIYLTQETALGWLVRGMHYWAAGMMVVVMTYHVLRHVALGGYLPPREGIWLVGVFIFFLVIFTSFIGYTLRWDERAIYGLRIALNIFYKVPLIGEHIVHFVQGGREFSELTLSRLYAAHVLIIPFFILMLLGYHLYLVLTYGSTTTLEKELGPTTAEEQITLRTYEKLSEEHGEPFFPDALAKTFPVVFMVFLLVFVLALTAGPQTLFPEANLTEESFPVEEWWFHWYSSLAAYLPPRIAHHFHWLFWPLLFLLMLSLPFIDKGHRRGLKRRPFAVACVALIVAALLGLTGVRYYSPWTAWPTTALPPVPPGEEMTAAVAHGRKLFVQYGCYNCHAIGGQGSGFAPNLTSIRSRMGLAELKQFILQPPDSVAMPAYQGRISEEDLQRVAEYVLAAQTYPREF